MKSIKLKKLTINNFKGTKYFTFDLSDENLIIGDNGTGKSTIIDAYSWLMIGKNAAGETDFGIKAKNDNGEVINKLDHYIEGVFVVEDKEISLKRLLREKWVKKNGTNDSKFQGHETLYYIDDVKIGMGKYNKIIKDILGISAKDFLVITDPMYFSKKLHWKDRREYISKLIPDISHQSVIDSDEELKDLELGLTDLEDFRLSCGQKAKSCNEELKNIPVQIEGMDSMIEEVKCINFESIETQVNEKQEKLNHLEEKKASVTKDSVISDINIEKAKSFELYTKIIIGLESDLSDFENERIIQASDAKKELINNLSICNEKLNIDKLKLSELNASLNSIDSKIKQLPERIKTYEVDLNDLRYKYDNRSKEELEFIYDTTCPSCGRSCMCGSEDAETKAKEEFNKRKDADLKSINKKGKEIVHTIETLKKELEIFSIQKHELIENEITPLVHQCDKKSSEIESLKKEIEDLNIDTSEIDEKIAIQKQLIEEQKNERSAKKRTYEEKVEELRKGSDTMPVFDIENQIKEIKADIDLLKDELAKKSLIDTYNINREKLLAKEKRLSKDWQHWENQIRLIGILYKKYAEAIEYKVNSNFKNIKVRLFDIQINEGIKEACEIMIPCETGLVDYSDANFASQINAGIDISNTFSKVFDITLPVFIDNKESITAPMKTAGQIIYLEKVTGQKELIKK